MVDNQGAVRSKLRLRLPLLVAGLACSYSLLRHFLSPDRIGPPPADHLRVVSWNLRNFPGDHDLEHLRDRLERLEPQVVAAQEILDPDALRRTWPHLRWEVSASGGRHGQHLAIGWDPAQVEVLGTREHEAIGMDGHVRPGLSAYVRTSSGDLGFRLLVVHLKATRDGLELRRQQWPRLLDAALEHIGSDLDDDVLVVGDFNVAGGPETSSHAELEQLERALAPGGLVPWESTGGCTAYWQGSRRDGWWEPSRLDLVWSRGFADLAPDRRIAWSGTHCARFGCGPIHASDHHPDPDLHGISDHCPVVVDLPRHHEP